MNPSRTITVDYTPPKTVRRFLRSNAFVRWIVGPVGSGKSSACVMEILRRASQQGKGPDGVRRTRFAIVRNTYPELRDTTRKTFEQWVPDPLGKWHEQEFIFEMRFGDVHCEVLFRALDRPEDVKKLLSLELTGAYINEAREVPKHVFDVLQTRVGRYPSKAQGGCTWFGVWADTNPWHAGHWGKRLFESGPDGYELYRQPSGRSSEAENTENLPPGYYDRLCAGKDSEWIKVYVDGEDANADVGAVFSKSFAIFDRNGSLQTFEHGNDEVFTNWDLGHGDSTAIWFWRLNDQRMPDIIEHFEDHGHGLDYYFNIIDSRPYSYRCHFLPHDARAKNLQTGLSVLEQFLSRYDAGLIDIVPQLSINDGIAAFRWLLEQPGLRVHTRCLEKTIKAPALGLEASGMDALREYRHRWDEKNQCFSDEPLHNWASHTADAGRYLALAFKNSERITRKPPPPEPLRVEPRFEDLWKEASRHRDMNRVT